MILTESQSTPLLELLTKKEAFAPHQRKNVKNQANNNVPIVNGNSLQPKLGVQYQKRNLQELISNHKMSESNKKLITEALIVIILNARVEDIEIVRNITEEKNIPLVICG